MKLKDSWFDGKYSGSVGITVPALPEAISCKATEETYGVFGVGNIGAGLGESEISPRTQANCMLVAGLSRYIHREIGSSLL